MHPLKFTMNSSISAPEPSPATLSRPLLAVLLFSFLLDSGSGLGLWLWPDHAWRAFHGWTIPPLLITLGVIWKVHVLCGWHLRKNVWSGALTLILFLILTSTGWTIYYAGSDGWQKAAGRWHTWLGLGSFPILLTHSILGLRCRSKSEMIAQHEDR